MNIKKEIKKLGYGVGIHYNSYREIFEVYEIGTYHPSQPSLNLDTQKVSKSNRINKAIKNFKKNYK